MNLFAQDAGLKLKSSIFVKYAPINKSPGERLELLYPLLSRYGMEVGKWYSKIAKDCDGEYYPYEDIENLEGWEELKSRTSKNKSGEWNTTLDLFSNETFYIGVYQNQHRSDPCISSRQCKYEQGGTMGLYLQKG